jgi:hypothetical protein
MHSHFSLKALAYPSFLPLQVEDFLRKAKALPRFAGVL